MPPTLDSFIFEQLQVGAHCLSGFIFADIASLTVAVLNTQGKQSAKFLIDLSEHS